MRAIASYHANRPRNTRARVSATVFPVKAAANAPRSPGASPVNKNRAVALRERMRSQIF